MRAPDEATRPESEIVDECVGRLVTAMRALARTVPEINRCVTSVRPSIESEDIFWPDVALPTKADDLQWPDFDEDLLVAKLEVKSAIRFLRAVSEKPFWGNKSENRTSLEAVRDAVQPLREAFAKAPGEALAALFLEGDIADTEVPPKAARDEVTKRLHTVVTMLDNIKARCGELLSSPPGIHGSAGFRQKQAAARAWDLLTRRGLKPTTPATGLFHHVTRLLHEAVDGPSDADLTRACRAVIAERK
jgi:hypothetical protein